MATILSPPYLTTTLRDFKSDAQAAEKFENQGTEIFTADDVSVRVMRIPQTGKQLAVKRSELNKRTSLPQLEQEISSLLNLQHPCITRLCEVYIHEGQLYQVFEYAPGNSLMTFVDKRLLSEPQCRYLFQQLAAAVEFCHSQGAPGRDLKLENILLTRTTPPEVKLADPAIAKHSPFADIGCPGSIYAAPEQLKSRTAKGAGVIDRRAADVWSLGVILAAILFHAYPFADPEQPKNITRIFENILAGRYFLPANVSLSSDCKDLLARIFVVDPAARITVPEIRRHPWFERDLPRKLATPYKPSENGALRAQAERVIKALRERRAEQTREAVKSYIV